MKGFGFVFLWLVGSTLAAQSTHQQLREADRAYDRARYDDAELGYRKSLEKGYSPFFQYNLGNSLYKQQRFDEAAKQFGEVADKATDDNLRADALFNQGGAYFEQQQFEQAAEAYKKSLRARPNDMQTKRNLAMALQQIKKQAQQQQQNKDDKNNSDPQDDPPQNDKNKPQNGDQDQQQDTPAADEQQSMKRREAEQMLDIIDDEEAKVQQKLRKGKTKPSKSNKDW